VANLGHRPRKLESHGNEALKARLSGLLNRAFSADLLLFHVPGALPQAHGDFAPVALT